MSYRAALALAAANAEWIAWRYEGRADNTTLLQFIEAVWAGVVDPAYVNLWTTFSKPGANHPASSALTRAGRLLYSVFWGARHLSSGCTREASYVAVLARHVLADKEVFERWLLAVISRIAPLYPGIGVPDRLGVPVPREAFDPDFAFKPELATDLLRDSSPNSIRYGILFAETRRDDPGRLHGEAVHALIRRHGGDMLTKPAYLETAANAGKTLSFRWDDWICRDHSSRLTKNYWSSTNDSASGLGWR